MSEELSIKKFYENREIFVTGGSGFVGKTLIEKLLRSCDGLKKIYLLMRPKEGQSASDRIKNFADDHVKLRIFFKNLIILRNQFSRFLMFCGKLTRIIIKN